MARFALFSFLIVALAASDSMALEADFIDGTHATKEGCAWRATDASKRDPDLAPVVLDKTGLHNSEWNCTFAQIFEHEPDKSWVAVVFCQESDFHSPDMVSIRRRDNGSFTISLASDSESFGELVSCKDAEK